MNSRYILFCFLSVFTMSIFAQNPIFQSSFEKDVFIHNQEDGYYCKNQKDDIRDGDIMPFDWETTLENNPYLGNFDDFYIQYVNGNENQRQASIDDDPSSEMDKALKFSIFKPSSNYADPNCSNVENGVTGSNGRIQANYSMSNDYGTGYKTFHYSVKLFLPNEFIDYSNDINFQNGFLTIVEFFNDIGYNAVEGEDFPFRVKLDIVKISGERGIRFRVNGEQRDWVDGELSSWRDNWLVDSNVLDSIFNQWLSLEIKFIEGDDTSGSFELSVVDGNDNVLVDINHHDYTHHPSNSDLDGITHIQPMKLYTSTSLISRWTGSDPDQYNNSSLDIYWDDFIIYDDLLLRNKLIGLIKEDCENGININDMIISADHIPNVGVGNNWFYKFKFVDNSNNSIFISSTNETIDLSNYPNLPFVGGEDYKVYVKIQNHPYTQYYGLGVDNYCTITYPILTSNRNLTNAKLKVGSNLSIYPNPTNNILNINMGSETKANSYDVFDIRGERIKYRSEMEEKSFKVDISALNKGVYFVRLIDDNGSQHIKKFIKL